MGKNLKGFIIYLTRISGCLEKIMQAKIVLCGDGYVGKSTIRERYLGIAFRPAYLQTIGADYATKNQIYSETNESIRLQIWDLAGQQKFSNIRETFYKGTDGVVLVYDVSNPSSADKIIDWIKEIRKIVHEPVPMILVANKIDLRTEIDCLTTQQGTHLVEELSNTFDNSIQLIESSAKTGENIDKIFAQLAKSVVNFRTEDLGEDKIDSQSFQKYYNEVQNFNHLYFFKMTPVGPSCIAQTDFPKDDVLLIKMAVFYATTLGQGTTSHTGLFGPLPIPDSKDTKYTNLQSLIYSFTKYDKHHHDPRAKNINFCFIVISIAKDLIFQFNNNNAILRFFHDQLHKIKDVEEITNEYLLNLKKALLKDVFLINNQN